MIRSINVATASLAMLWIARVAGAEVPSLSSYGTPGIVEVPTAQIFDEGQLAFTVSYSGLLLRNTATFQVLPRLYGSFRYAVVDGFFEDGVLGDDALYDRSFDIHYQLLEETSNLPALGIGLRDFLGTGILSSEYIVATKQVTDDLTLTGGLGWGRLAGRNSVNNPLSILGFGNDERQARFSGTGGQVETGRWFRGPASFFGGLNWQINDQISAQLEYSPDIYDREAQFSDIKISSPINASVQYRFDIGVDAKVYVIGGENAGFQLSYFLDPRTRIIPGGREPAPSSILPRSSLAAASWNLDGPTGAIDFLRRRLASEGLSLDDAQITAASATVFIQNNRWDVEAQAAGRAARVMANTLPPQVEDFTVVFQERGVPISAVTTKRSDLEDLQYSYDAAWLVRARTDIDDASRDGAVAPSLDYSITPYAAFSFFDPQSPIRADFGPQLAVSYQAAPGLTFDALFRYPLFGNLGDSERESDSVIERVRSESFLFARESDFEINLLTAEYLWRPSADMFARVTGGYLENQFGGVSGEVLWSPINSRFALGAELNYARQRDFDMLLGFQDYDVFTGHASAYYDFDNGFHTQLDLGRYLAGDWGGTLTVNREFNNGVRIGGYFTLTDVSFDDFGEGSFDKGLRVEIPLSFITGQPSRRVLGQTIQPIQRDGGARLEVENRLYPLTRDYRGAELSDGWGRYLR